MNLKPRSPLIAIALLTTIISSLENTSRGFGEKYSDRNQKSFKEGTYDGQSYKLTLRYLNKNDNYRVDIKINDSETIRFVGFYDKNIIDIKQNECQFSITRLSEKKIELLEKKQSRCKLPSNGRSVFLTDLYDFNHARHIFQDGVYKSDYTKIKLEKLNNGDEYLVRIDNSNQFGFEEYTSFVGYQSKNQVKINAYGCTLYLTQHDFGVLDLIQESKESCHILAKAGSLEGTYRITYSRLTTSYMKFLQHLGDFGGNRP